MAAQMAMAVTTLALAGPNAKNPGDWPCQFCKKVNFARDIQCQGCGARRPVAGTYGTPLPKEEENPMQSPTGQPGDWSCPKCKAVCFARNPVCGRCNCPKPETLEEYQLFAAAAAGCLPGQCGSARGYVPPSAQLKADGASPWARQWCAGPANGMFVGETSLPAWLRGTEEASSSSSGKGKKRKAEGKAAAKADAKKRPKIKKKFSGLSKEEVAKKKAEEEEEKRRQMRERRKGRVISVD